MKTLLAALLSYAGSEIVSRIAQVVFGGKGKVADAVKEIAPDVDTGAVVSRVPAAGKKFLATLKAKYKARMGRDITSDEIVAVQEALEDE